VLKERTQFGVIVRGQGPRNDRDSRARLVRRIVPRMRMGMRPGKRAGSLKSWAEHPHPRHEKQERIPGPDVHLLEQARSSGVISAIEGSAIPGATKTSALLVVTVRAIASFARTAKTGGTDRHGAATNLILLVGHGQMPRRTRTRSRDAHEAPARYASAFRLKRPRPPHFDPGLFWPCLR
jgi:hypothetical protein